MIGEMTKSDRGRKEDGRGVGGNRRADQTLTNIDLPQTYLDSYLELTQQLWKKQYKKTYLAGPVVQKEVRKYKSSYDDGTLFGILKSKGWVGLFNLSYLLLLVFLVFLAFLSFLSFLSLFLLFFYFFDPLSDRCVGLSLLHDAVLQLPLELGR